MKRALIILTVLVAAACGGGNDVGDGDGDTADTVPPADASPAYVGETTIAIEGDTVTVTITGDLPTPCHAPQTTIATSRPITEGDESPRTRVDVTIWSESDADEPCAQVLEPFEVSVSASVEEGGADVYVNEELVGSVG